MTTWTQLAVEHVSAITKEEFSTTHRRKTVISYALLLESIILLLKATDYIEMFINTLKGLG